MTAQSGTTLYVWRRNTEAEPSRWIWWAIGVVVLLAGFGAFAAYMADNGEMSTFLALGVILSVLIWSIPRVYRWARLRHPDIIMEGREMVWAKQRVPIDQVEQWSAGLSRQSFSNETTISRYTIGIVKFEMIGGQKQKFAFSHLNETELAELIAAIDPILPGRRIDWSGP